MRFFRTRLSEVVRRTAVGGAGSPSPPGKGHVGRFGSPSGLRVLLAVAGIHRPLLQTCPPTKCGPFPPPGFPRPHQYYGPLRLPLRSPPLHGVAAYRVRRSQATTAVGSHGVSLLGRRRVSPVPLMALPPFHALYAAGFFGAASPSTSPLPWPSPSHPRLGSRLHPLRGKLLRRGRLRFMLRTGGLHPPKADSTLRFDAQVSPNAGRLLQRWLGPSFGRTCTG